jgi:hypothetical protein
LQAEISKLESVTQVQQEIASRRGLAEEALSDDIDWVALDSRLVAALPAGVQLTGLTFTETTPTPGSAGTSVAAGGSYIGSVTISAQTNAGPPSVAEFVDRASKVEGLAGLWVSNAASTSGTSGGPGAHPELTFQATAEVTPQALSNRALLLPGGKS